MPKTIAITPSWYWPAGIPRVIGVPPFSVYELCVQRPARRHPEQVALVSGDTSLTFGDLHREVEARTGPLAHAVGESRLAVISGGTVLEDVLGLLAGLAAGVRIRLVPPGSDVSTSIPESAGDGTPPVLLGPRGDLGAPAVTIDGSDGLVHHSNRSLLAMAISLTTFLDASAQRSWINTLPVSRWEGLLATLAPLYLGGTLVLPPPDGDSESTIGAIRETNAAYIVADLDEFSEATRESKRAAKQSRGVLDAALLAVPGAFFPDRRRRVSKALECSALTFWGMPETGPVFASHQSWYIDESVGIPMTNAHVVPADPRTGTPIQALWELVESAEVTVFSPSLACRPGDGSDAHRFAGNRFRTGMIASSDANGMVYLLND
jgi:hypothetical protein